jgi:hypothetical protein
MGPFESLDQMQVHFCGICNGPGTSRHHFIPKEVVHVNPARKDDTVRLCSVCHRDVHFYFSNMELAMWYNTTDSIRPELERRKGSPVFQQTKRNVLEYLKRQLSRRQKEVARLERDIYDLSEKWPLEEPDYTI